ASGVVQIMFDTAVSASANIKSGRTRALAVTTKRRSALFPELPTIDEAGVKGFDLDGWGGLAGPAGMPADITAKLQQQIGAILKQPDMLAGCASLGAAPGGMPPQEFGRFIQDEAAKWKRIVVESGAKLD